MKFNTRLLHVQSTRITQMKVFAVLTLCWMSPVFAQGGMGGAVSGLFSLVLGIIGIVALLILIVIRRAFGTVAVGIVLLFGLVFFVERTWEHRAERAKRDQAYATAYENMVQQCLSQGEEKFNIALSGKEKTSVVVVGKEKIGRLPPEFVLDLKKLPEDVSVYPRAPDELPGLDAIDVIVTYTTPMMIGPAPKYQVSTSAVDIVVKRAIDGVQIAHRKDVSLDRGYCLGPQPKYGMIGFLRKALNRPDFFDEGSKRNDSYRMPFHYIPVVATFDDPVKGRFAETELSSRDTRTVRYEMLRTSIATITNCTLGDIKYSNSYATCLSGTAEENKLNLMDVYGIVKRDDSWLAILPGGRQITGLHTLLIEQRDVDGKPMLAWVVNFKVPKAFTDLHTGFTLADAKFDQQKMSLNLVWKSNHSFSDNTYKNGREWFEMQSTVHAELPGLR
ncbi:TrbC/VirB2 family protein [Undibacterium sp. TC9W]|uniref:TrbC/VirB2 family protein n=1 Tax=Undibacterium sp. TC9W TaxID=3413053 RepID=UPI003BF2AA23